MTPVFPYQSRLLNEFARSARCRRCKRRHVRRRVSPHRASRVRSPWTAGMATVSSSARADDAHAAWVDPGDSPQSFRLTASPSAIVESGAACPDRLQTRLPSVAGACRVQRPAAATCPVFSPRRVTSASPNGGKRSRAASRRDGAVSIARKTARSEMSRRSGGIRPIGGVARAAARSCADAATTLTAANAPGRRAARGFSARRPRLAKRDLLPRSRRRTSPRQLCVRWALDPAAPGGHPGQHSKQHADADE